MSRLLLPTLALALTLTLGATAGCLPHGALSSHDTLPADRYTVVVGVSVTTEPAGIVPAFGRTWSFDVVTRWARDFRDGSRGRYVRFERAQTWPERAVIPLPSRPDLAWGASPLQGAWLELRTFDSGEILAVEPLEGHVGREAGSLEALDLVWAALSPAPPDVSRRKDAAVPPDVAQRLGDGDLHHALTSIPTSIGRDLRLRTVLAGWWSRVLTQRAPACATVRRCAAFSWIGTLDGATEGDSVAPRGPRPAPRPVRVRGEARGSVALDTDAARVVSSELTATRVVSTHWPAGSLAALGVTAAQDLVQRQDWDIAVTWTGTIEAPRFAAATGAHASARADAAPLTLVDGSTADGGAPTGLPAPDALPFLLLPDRVSSTAPETR